MLKLVTLVFAGLAILSTTASSSSDDPPQKPCKQVFSEQNAKQTRWTNECIKKLGLKTGRDKTRKSACVQRCILENFSLLNDQGYVDSVQYGEFLVKEWPSYMVDRANVTFQPCLGLKRNEVEGPDEYCKGIEPITKCLTRNFSNLCKGVRN